MQKKNTNFLYISCKEKNAFEKIIKESINNNVNLPLNDSWGVNMISFLKYIIRHKLKNTSFYLDSYDKKQLLQFIQNTNFENEKLKQKLLDYCLNLNKAKTNNSEFTT